MKRNSIFLHQIVHLCREHGLEEMFSIGDDDTVTVAESAVGGGECEVEG